MDEFREEHAWHNLMWYVIQRETAHSCHSNLWNNNSLINSEGIRIHNCDVPITACVLCPLIEVQLLAYLLLSYTCRWVLLLNENKIDEMCKIID